MAAKDRNPTDSEILAAVGKHGGRAMTYVVRNVLWTDGFRKETPWVLRQLKRLERHGMVERVPTSYVTQICWKVIHP